MKKESATRRFDRVFPGVIVLVITAALVWFAVGWYLNNAQAEQAREPYAGGRLIDVNGLIIYEGAEEIEEVGWRLVCLASGEKFTEEQIRQLKGLVMGLFGGWRFTESLSDREKRSLRGQEYR